MKTKYNVDAELEDDYVEHVRNARRHRKLLLVTLTVITVIILLGMVIFW